jgi:type II secretory pathway pseudopilin PulG
VLILLILLVGVAMILLSTSRSDVFSATNERESAIAFYAAEAGIAYGKSYLSSTPYDPALKFSAVLKQAPMTRTFDYQVPGTTPPITIPASFTISFRNNDDGAGDAGGDNDGIVVIHSEGVGPNQASAVVEVSSGIKDYVRSGTGYCAQANAPPSCRGQ